MRMAKVIGQVWATQKVSTLIGKKLLLLQPYDFESQKAFGDELVAVDTVQAGIGDTVFFVLSREATLPLPEPFNPVDATIVGILDRLDLADRQIHY
jgi:ethanolamine utilization protein EutN